MTHNDCNDEDQRPYENNHAPPNYKEYQTIRQEHQYQHQRSIYYEQQQEGQYYEQHDIHRRHQQRGGVVTRDGGETDYRYRNNNNNNNYTELPIQRSQGRQASRVLGDPYNDDNVDYGYGYEQSFSSSGHNHNSNSNHQQQYGAPRGSMNGGSRGMDSLYHSVSRRSSAGKGMDNFYYRPSVNRHCSTGSMVHRPPSGDGDGYRHRRPSGDGYRNPRPSGDGYRNPRPIGDGYRHRRPSGDGYRNRRGSTNGTSYVQNLIGRNGSSTNMSSMNVLHHNPNRTLSRRSSGSYHGSKYLHHKDSTATTTTTTTSRRIWERQMVEIMPGVQVPMRGADETECAIEEGRIQSITCVQCEIRIVCIDEASLVICPSCRSIAPTNSLNTCTEDSLGLGFDETKLEKKSLRNIE